MNQRENEIQDESRRKLKMNQEENEIQDESRRKRNPR